MVEVSSVPEISYGDRINVKAIPTVPAQAGRSDFVRPCTNSLGIYSRAVNAGEKRHFDEEI